MTGKFLIDVTDPRFDIPHNADVLAFVRRANPFAHSDVGSLLLVLGKGVAGSHAYMPSFRDCAYVVLHDDAWSIFAIAFGQRGLAFRLAPSSVAAALADGGAVAPQIGSDWVSFEPWDVGVPTDVLRARLERWCSRAYSDRSA
jgi:hypothetical protein